MHATLFPPNHSSVTKVLPACLPPSHGGTHIPENPQAELAWFQASLSESAADLLLVGAHHIFPSLLVFTLYWARPSQFGILERTGSRSPGLDEPGCVLAM